MSASSPLATTSQAAEILGVHESSIKRWNSANQLHAQQTSGGHRRFLVSEILTFARENKLDAPLLYFGSYAERVWVGIEYLRKKGSYRKLIPLLYTWVLNDKNHLSNQLLVHLTKLEYSVSHLMDNLISPVLYRLGDEYLKGELAIGDEHRGTHAMRNTIIYFRERLRELNYIRLSQNKPVAIVGCGRGEDHEIGALMARLVLEVRGLKVVYLGLNVPTEEFAKQQIKHEASVVCIALMPPRGERDAHHILHLLDQVYNRYHPYRLAFGGGAIKGESVFSNLKVTIPEVRHFKNMESFSTWIKELND